MPKHKLTKTFVDSVPLESTGQRIYRDAELPGFALRVTRVKSYIAERKLNGRTVRTTIGQHGVYTPAEAREAARRVLGDLARGIDPNARRREQQAVTDPTLLEAFTAYIAERPLKANTLRDYQRCMDDYFADWRKLPLRVITRKMVQQRHTDLTLRSPARANLAMRFLRAVFNWAIEHYLDAEDQPVIAGNPVRTLAAKRAWNRIKPRTAHIPDAHLGEWVRAVWRYTDEFAGMPEDERFNATRDYLFTLLLTGFRREECAALPWVDVDLIAGTVTSRDPKNGEEHTLPMGPFLWMLMRRRKARATGPYVFPAESDSGHLIDRRKAMTRIGKSGGMVAYPHAIRRTFSTIVERLAIGQYTMKRLLNHKISGKDITAIYPQISMDRLREAMGMVEQHVLRAAGMLPLV